MIRRYPPWDIGGIFGDLDWGLSTRSETCGLFLGVLIPMVNAGYVLEIGIAKAFYTSIILKALDQSLAPERLLVSCDISAESCERAEAIVVPGGITKRVMCEDSSKVDWVGRADGRRCDIAVIDGGHDYQYVSEDIRRVKLLVKAGGFMVVHDHWEDMEGIVEAVKEELGTWGKIQFPGNAGFNSTPFLVAQKPGGFVWGRRELLGWPNDDLEAAKRAGWVKR